MMDQIRRYVLNSYKVCDDIDPQGTHVFHTPIQQGKRNKIKIAVIDDQPFEAGMNLRNYGYQIVEHGDIKKLNEIDEYPIILCDLMNVGLNFDQESQGSSIIKEIKKNYPSKFIAAYSGSSAASLPAQRSKQYADVFIKKDSEIEGWVEKLDALISSATDPRQVWLRIRSAMIEENVNTRTILLLEDAYVRSVMSSKPNLSLLRELTIKENIGSAAKNIIYGLASSAIFSALS